MSENATLFAQNLRHAETACDATLSSYTELMLMAQRVSADALLFGEAQGLLADLNEAMGLHIRARHHLARVHAKSREIADRNGMMPTGWGDTSETFSEARDTNGTNIATLRAVA
jgi:hypothetical protein